MNFDQPLSGPRRNAGRFAGAPSHEMTRLICVEPLDSAAGGGSRDSSGMLELWHLLRDHKLAIALLAFLGVAVAILLSMLQTPMYQARTTLEVQSMNEGGVEPFSEAAPGGGYAPETYLQTQARILESATLRSRVDKKVAEQYHPVARPPDRFASIRSALRMPTPVLAGAGSLPPIDMRVRPFEHTRLIEVRAEASDPSLAALFANTIGNEYIEYHMEARWNAAQRATQWLTLQLEKLKIKLRDSENKLQAYSRSTGLVFAGDKTNVEQAKLEQLQLELTRAQAERMSNQSAYEIASNAPADTVPQVLDNGRLSGYQAQIADLRRQLADLGPSLMPEHYKIIRVQEQIKAMESTLKRERDNIMTRIRNDYQTAVRREAALKAAYDRQARLVSEQAAKSVNYDILRREADSNRKLYDQLLEKVQGAGLASAMKATNIRVVDPAEAPTSPSTPNLPQNLALGLATGLLAGRGLSGRRRPRQSQPQGARRDALPSEGAGVGRNPPEKRPGSRAHGSLAPLRTPANDNVEMVTWHDRPSVLAESFRSALASILVSEQDGAAPARDPGDQPRTRRGQELHREQPGNRPRRNQPEGAAARRRHAQAQPAQGIQRAEQLGPERPAARAHLAQGHAA